MLGLLWHVAVLPRYDTAPGLTMRIPPLDVSHGPQVIELAFSDTHYVKSVTELYSQMTIVLVRTISLIIFSTPQNCFSSSSLLYSFCRAHLKPSLLWLPLGYVLAHQAVVVLAQFFLLKILSSFSLCTWSSPCCCHSGSIWRWTPTFPTTLTASTPSPEKF